MKIVSIYFESHFVQKNLLQFSPVGWFQLGQLQQLKNVSTNEASHGTDTWLQSVTAIDQRYLAKKTWRNIEKWHI